MNFRQTSNAGEVFQILWFHEIVPAKLAHNSDHKICKQTQTISLFFHSNHCEKNDFAMNYGVNEK